MEKNELSKQATEPQQKFLQQLEYCLLKVSDVMLPNFKVAFESLQIGNCRFTDDNLLVLLDVTLPYTVEDVAVYFDIDDSGWATIRFTFSKDKRYAEYDFSGFVGDTNCNETELHFVHFLLELGGEIDPHSPYADLIDLTRVKPKDFSSVMADYFTDGMK